MSGLNNSLAFSRIPSAACFLSSSERSLFLMRFSFSNAVNGPLSNSSPHAQDRQLIIPGIEILVAVAEPLTPSKVSAAGERLRQPDGPGGKRVTTVEKFRECAAFAFKGRQIVALLP